VRHGDGSHIEAIAANISQTRHLLMVSSRRSSLLADIAEWLEFGVESVWVVDPETAIESPLLQFEED
jgi:hypothetical protein